MTLNKQIENNHFRSEIDGLMSKVLYSRWNTFVPFGVQRELSESFLKNGFVVAQGLMIF
tara:strand:- start:5 stop:181 length:177 start_codon:yes stop_codon:yes gene_type:complete